MKIIGKQITCDRCGKQIMLKQIGKFDLDGGFSGRVQYEDVPKGWRYLSDSSKDLCPDCAKEYDEVMKRFLEV